MSVILNAEKVSKTFSNQQLVLKPTSIKINRGEIYVIEGKSGSGKSTLLSILGGLEKPTSGRVYYRNSSFYELNDEKQSEIRGKSFGFIFQSFHLIPELSVKQNIELPLTFNTVDNRLETKDLAKRLEIEYLLDKETTKLSGGEQQRVAIARSLITLPDIVFADEPTGNLDHKTTRKIVNLLSELSNIYGISLVIVTHEKKLIKEPHHLFEIQDGELRVKNRDV
ncbi:ABC transporter ATP-binding protein [Ornithinibacillus bavariensis]|uniref:ABC transporter ATP-binding protein n=1 Tax=Ornithinibacillus bavariensis TaxID=545502 RepID=A0A920C7R1_9BACI|nr:ABC transporter ATP-binding protein [Ornithinibacillus bavariensis]GIO27459.1 ABC transporter ATP-binding protein [Ornithinibacillus bavariensis]